MFVTAKKKWLKQSGLRAVYTILDALLGAWILESAGLFDLNVALLFAAAVSAGVACFLRSTLGLLKEKKERWQDEISSS